jgi:hypothetical protein
MNLRKLLAGVAGVSLLAQTVIPAGVFGATAYGAEMESAYTYAYDKGVTTQSPIERANMYGALTRVEMSKMIANWAEQVVGTKADTSRACNFTDLGGVKDQELYGTIIKSCQMGIMGQGISQFRPFDVVTRAEFGTILSRVLWGNKYDGETPYYAAHLNALKTAGIMTQITDPENTKEVRGYVMIMLQRADEKGTTTDVCKDPLVMLACALDSDDCPAECKASDEKDDDGDTTVVKAGNLEVSVSDYSSAVKSAPSVGTVIFNAVDFESSESITVNSIQLERIGLSSRSDIKGVWFEKDGVQISSKGNVSTDSKITLNFNKGFMVKSNESLDLVVELSGSIGSEIAFRFIDLNSSAKNVSFNNKTTTTYRTTSYEVAKIDFSKNGGGDAIYKLGTQNEYTFGQFSIANQSTTDDKVINVKSITLRNNGTADLNNLLKNVKVLRDNKDVVKSVSFDGRNLIISFDDTIEGGKRAIYTITAEIAALDRVGDTVQLDLRKGSDLVAYEKATGFRTMTTPINPNTDDSVSLPKYTIEGGRVSFSNDSTFPKTIEAGSGATEVIIAQGNITTSESIKLGASKFAILNETGKTLRTLSLEIGGSRYTATPIITNGNTTFSFDEIYINRNETVKLIATIDSQPSTGTIKVVNMTNSTNVINGTTFANGEYENGEILKSDTVAGAVQIATITVKTPQFSLRNNASNTQNVVKGDTTTKVVFDGTLTSAKGKVTVNQLVLTPTVNGLTGATIDLNLYVNDSAYGYASVSSS